MHQRDYILRLIEQLGAVLIRLRKRLLEGGDASGVRDELAGVASRAGFDVELLRRFDLDTLHMLVAPTGEVEPARCWLMAEVLFVDGIHARAQGDGRAARASLLKARALYELVRPRGGMLVGLPEADDRIAELDGLLEDYEPAERADDDSEDVGPADGPGRSRRHPRRRRAAPRRRGPQPTVGG